MQEQCGLLGDAIEEIDWSVGQPQTVRTEHYAPLLDPLEREVFLILVRIPNLYSIVFRTTGQASAVRPDLWRCQKRCMIQMGAYLDRLVAAFQKTLVFYQ